MVKITQSPQCSVASHVRLFLTPWSIPARLFCPWDFAGKNTGVGCHFFLQGSSRPRDQTHVSHISHIAGGFLTTAPPEKPTQLPGGSYSFGHLWVQWLMRYVPGGTLKTMPIKLSQVILALVMYEVSKAGWLPNLSSVDTVSLHLSCE